MVPPGESSGDRLAFYRRRGGREGVNGGGRPALQDGQRMGIGAVGAVAEPALRPKEGKGEKQYDKREKCQVKKKGRLLHRHGETPRSGWSAVDGYRASGAGAGKSAGKGPKL